MNKKLLLITWVTLVTQLCFAGEEFKAQRRDLFKTMPVTSESIVMLGNSITNGSEWCEAFGNDNILNRGISGNTSSEVLARLEPIIIGKPKAIFLLIGINDGTDATSTVNSISAIIDKIKSGSPETKLYIQSVLPVNNTFSNFGQNSRGPIVASINEKLPALCIAKGVNFVDVWSEMRTSGSDNNLNKNYTNDGLHLLGGGYRKWGTVIEDRVGTPSCFLDITFAPIANAHTYINQRISNFASLPVNDGDVLMLGDYYINTGEWHELLRNPKVKNRGIGVDMPATSIDLNNLFDMLPHVIKGNPTKVFLYCGLVDLLNNTTPTNAAVLLKKSIDYIKNNSQAEIYIQSLLPRNNPTENTSKIDAYNKEIAKFADNQRIHYVDLYKEFIGSDNKIKTDYASNASNISGLGYVRWANQIYKYIDPSILPISESITLLSSAINTAEEFRKSVEPGTAIGYYDAAACEAFDQSLNESKLLLQDPLATEEQRIRQQEKLSAATQQLRAALIMPQLSDDKENHYYRLYTPLRGNRYITSNGTNSGVTGETSATTKASQWKFTLRNDKSWNIVNCADGSFLSPEASNNTQLSSTSGEPSKGWTLSPASTSGLYIISGGTAQINQTNGTAVYNWGGGSNTSDAGCQYRIVYVDAEQGRLPEPILDQKNLVFNGSSPTRLLDEQAAEIFKLTDCTVVVDFTSAATSSQPQIIIGSSNTNVTSQFFGISLYDTRYSVRFTNEGGSEGYFSSNFANEADAKSRHQLIFVMQNKSPHYSYYKEGVLARTADASGSYPFRTFGNVPGVNSMYIGGLVSSDNSCKYSFKGTIHSVRIYPTALNPEQIASIEYPQDIPIGIIPTLNGSKDFTLSGTTLKANDGAKGSLYVYNTGGKLIKKIKSSADHSFDLSTLPQDCYIINLHTSDGKTRSGKINL